MLLIYRLEDKHNLMTKCSIAKKKNNNINKPKENKS